MKSFITRPTLLLTLALAVGLGLAGCGGKAKYTVKGNIIDSLGAAAPVKFDGLQLVNNGETITVPKGASKFEFKNQVEYGQIYNVTLGNPAAHEDCGIANPTDSGGRLADINILVTCNVQTHQLKITLNQAADGLVLTNGSSATTTLSGDATTAVFNVFYGDSYGVTVLTQPTNGTTCTVQNGVGTMADLDIDNVTVTCQ